MHCKIITTDFGPLVSRLSASPRLSARRLEGEQKTCRQTPNFILQNSANRTVNQDRCFTSNPSFRFKKHSNLIETNKQNIFRKQSLKSDRFVVKAYTKQKNGTNVSHYLFNKGNKETILKGSILEDEKRELNFTNLQRVLKKNKMKNHKNLLGYNILALEKRYSFSRFQLYVLHSMYNTLLLHSKSSIKSYRKNFQVILHMNKLSVRPEILEKLFKQQRQVSFEKFIEMYGSIDKAIFKQNMIDYIQNLFEGIYDKQKIRFYDIIRIMRNRLSQKQAADISKIMFDQYDRKYDDLIRLEQITELFNKCEDFAKKIYKMYSRDVKCE